VLAMTANAMVGDREKALEAGMNDHIAKPLNVTDMFTTMARWITPTDPRSRPAQTSTPATGNEAIGSLEGVDTAAGLATCAGNESLYRRLLWQFAVSNQDFGQAFLEAQSSADQDAPMRLAHTLKGVAGSIGATQVAHAAKELEDVCKTATASAVPARHLEQLLAVLAPVLRAIEAARDSLSGSESVAQGPALAIAPTLTQLREALENFDPKSRDIAEKLLSAVSGTDHEAAIDTIIGHIDNFDFGEALATLTANDATLAEVDATIT